MTEIIAQEEEANTVGTSITPVTENDLAPRLAIVVEEDGEKLDAAIKNITDYIADNPASGLLGASEEEKNKKYETVTSMWNELATLLRATRFRLPLSAQEFHFINNTITKHVEYSDATLMLGFKVLENFLEPCNKYSSKVAYMVHEITPDTMVLIYHLLTNHKVTGLGMSARHFRSVLEGLGAISKVFDTYDKSTKALSEAITNWTVGLDEDSVKNQTAPATEITAEVVEKKKKSAK